MQTRHSQRGVTLLGFLMILTIAGFFAYIGMRLFPVYTEWYSVVRCMNDVAAEPGNNTKSPEQIKESLNRKFYISYVSSVKMSDVKVIREGGKNSMNVHYEVRGPLVYNLEFLATFDKTVKL
jgi:hypothetical protein